MGPYKTQLETTFGGVFAKISLQDFAQLGNDFGDSFNFEFSNGKKVYDIPYYSGYYTKDGESLLCGYQGYPYVYMSFNTTDGYWWKDGLMEEDTVIITLNEKGKYKDIQDTFSLCYLNNRDAFDSDEVFANFREIKGGNIKEGAFFRGASPVDNEYNRAGYADSLLEKNGILYDVNLSDGIVEIEKYQSEHVSPYFNHLYESGKVVPMHMGAGFRTKKFAKQLSDGIRAMLKNEGPYYIHCVEGKDRTGFVAAVVLGLAHASFEEIADDYMITYDNYYGITEETNPKKYQAIKEIKICDYLLYLANKDSVDQLTDEAIFEGAKNYLRFAEMLEEEIESIISLINK